MKKTFITLTTFAVVGFGSLLVSEPAQAETIDDLKTKQSKVKDERAEIKKDLSEADAKVADVLIDLKEINNEISRLNDELNHNEEMIEKAEGNIAKTEKTIEEIEGEIDRLEKVIEERFDILKERASSYQKTGGNVGYMEVLFGSTSFNDFISRVSAVTKITESDAELIKRQEEDKAQVEIHQAEVEVQLNEHLDMKLELEGMKELIKEQQEETKENKKKLKKKEKELTSLVKELKTEDSTLSALESQINQNISSLQTPVTVATTSNNNNDNSNNNTNSSSNTNDNLTTVAKSSDTSNDTPSKPSPNSSSAIEAGHSQVGTSYKSGGKNPSGFDCSGFVSWAYGQTGKSIPSSTQLLRGMGQKVSLSEAQPGDLIFFDTNRPDGHVGIYLGNGQFIGSQSSTGVAVASLSNSYWSKTFDGHVRRIN